MRLARPLLAVLLLMPPAAAPAADVTHSPEHRAAVNRQRRIFIEYDPAADIQLEGGFGSDMGALMGYVFDFADMPGSQLDAICIDVSNEGVAHHRSTILRPIAHPGLVKWRAEGLDYFDCFHATDGYRGTYLHQGADGVGIFNGPAGSVEHAQRIGVQQQDAAVRDYHSEFLTMVGSLETLAGRPRSYAIDRRGGYAHGEGHGSANAAAPLPVDLRYDGGSAALTLRVWEGVPPGTAATLRLVLFNHVEGDELLVRLNGDPLDRTLVDASWKDPRIFSPLPQPETVTPGNVVKKLDQQRLTRVEFAVPVASLKRGPNHLAIAVNRTGPFPPSKPVKVEKVELRLE